MSGLVRRIAWLSVALVTVLVNVALAQTTVRVRGAVVDLSGQILTVKSREGATVPVRLADNYALREVKKPTVTEVKVGDYVGTAALRRPDGTFRAQEILIFPLFARGSAEGHSPWDLTPDSTMTNATVAQVEAKGDGRTLTLKYRGGGAPLSAPAAAPVVTFGIGHISQLVPGAHIFIQGTRLPDGTITTTSVLVGREHVGPPL